jgi:hypothetical protein
MGDVEGVVLKATDEFLRALRRARRASSVEGRDGVGSGIVDVAAGGTGYPEVLTSCVRVINLFGVEPTRITTVVGILAYWGMWLVLWRAAHLGGVRSFESLGGTRAS